MKTRLAVSSIFILALLAGCGLGGLAGPFPGGSSPGGVSSTKTIYPPAPAQTVYRIDENRYFEVEPFGRGACAYADLVYIDRLKEIRSKISLWKGYYGPNQNEVNPKFIIDAANKDYLVAPILGRRGDCGADTASRPWCSKRLPYSTDGGRSWKFIAPERTNSGAIVLTGDQVFFAHSTAKLSELRQGNGTWKVTWEEFPQPRKSPLDARFHCTPNGKE